MMFANTDLTESFGLPQKLQFMAAVLQAEDALKQGEKKWLELDGFGSIAEALDTLHAVKKTLTMKRGKMIFPTELFFPELSLEQMLHAEYVLSTKQSGCDHLDPVTRLAARLAAEKLPMTLAFRVFAEAYFNPIQGKPLYEGRMRRLPMYPGFRQTHEPTPSQSMML